MPKEIKWIYQSDAEEEEFLADLEHYATMIFSDLANPPIPIDAKGYIFDLHGVGFYWLDPDSFHKLKATWKESLLIREYRKEENQYPIG